MSVVCAPASTPSAFMTPSHIDAPPNMDGPSFSFEGIPIHPDHGIFLPPSSPFLVSSPSLPALEQLDIAASPDSSFDSPSSSSTMSSRKSSVSSVCSDYFTYRSPTSSYGAEEDDDFDTPPSSGHTTPTEETVKTSSLSPVTGLCISSPLECSSSTAREPLIPRHHPYARPSPSPLASSASMLRPPQASSSASMLRSFSTPVETAAQVNARLAHRASLNAFLAEVAPASPAPSSPGPALMVRDSPSALGRARVSAAYGPTWGAALPPRAPSMPSSSSDASTLAYPYNLARAVPTHPGSARFARSHSATDLPTVYSTTSPSSSSPSSPSAGRRPELTPAMKARKVLGPLTPIPSSSVSPSTMSDHAFRNETIRVHAEHGLSF